MKNAILALTAVLGFSANASYFQTYCSNGEGTIKLAEGHDNTYARVTERTWSETDYAYEDKTIETGLVYTYSNDVVISSESKTSCAPGDEYGLGIWSIVSSKKVVITKKDGGSFAENTIGVSQDLKSVQAFVICQEDGNSDMLCE